MSRFRSWSEPPDENLLEKQARMPETSARQALTGNLKALSNSLSLRLILVILGPMVRAILPLDSFRSTS